VSARDEWDALSLAHRVEAMKEIDEAVARCSQRAHDHEKRGDTARQTIAARKAANLAMLVDLLKEQEAERAAASRKAGGR